MEYMLSELKDTVFKDNKDIVPIAAINKETNRNDKINFVLTFNFKINPPCIM